LSGIPIPTVLKYVKVQEMVIGLSQKCIFGAKFNLNNCHHTWFCLLISVIGRLYEQEN
jgi:hypothetical protein